jgi:hypothetical protein
MLALHAELNERAKVKTLLCISALSIVLYIYIYMGPFTYYVSSQRGGGGLEMLTVAEGGGGGV